MGCGLSSAISNDPEEIARFLDHIQAGVTYVNRQGGGDHGGMARVPVVRRMEGLQ